MLFGMAEVPQNSFYVYLQMCIAESLQTGLTVTSSTFIFHFICLLSSHARSLTNGNQHHMAALCCAPTCVPLRFHHHNGQIWCVRPVSVHAFLIIDVMGFGPSVIASISHTAGRCCVLKVWQTFSKPRCSIFFFNLKGKFTCRGRPSTDGPDETFLGSARRLQCNPGRNWELKSCELSAFFFFARWRLFPMASSDIRGPKTVVW